MFIGHLYFPVPQTKTQGIYLSTEKVSMATPEPELGHILRYDHLLKVKGNQ